MPPQSRASRVASGAMMSTVRAPAMVRANTSRPEVVGAEPVRRARRLRASSSASGAVGLCVMNVEKRAMKTQKSTMMRPIMKVGLRSSALIEVAPLALLLGRRSGVGLELLLLGRCRREAPARACAAASARSSSISGSAPSSHGLVAQVGIRAERGCAVVVHLSRPSGCAG